MDWTRISLLFSNRMDLLYPDQRRGQYAVTMFLDWVLHDSCSKEVRQALVEAIREAEVRKEAP